MLTCIFFIFTFPQVFLFIYNPHFSFVEYSKCTNFIAYVKLVQKMNFIWSEVVIYFLPLCYLPFL
jgi:hypothetical protein